LNLGTRRRKTAEEGTDMTDLSKLMSELAVNQSLQQELLNVEPDVNAYHMFFKLKGFACTVADIESVFKDMIWFARVGTDIDHA
jgi:hypothetical protein